MDSTSTHTFKLKHAAVQWASGLSNSVGWSRVHLVGLVNQFFVLVFVVMCGEGERLQLLYPVGCLPKASAPNANVLHCPPVAASLSIPEDKKLKVFCV